MPFTNTAPVFLATWVRPNDDGMPLVFIVATFSESEAIRTPLTRPGPSRKPCAYWVPAGHVPLATTVGADGAGPLGTLPVRVPTLGAY